LDLGKYCIFDQRVVLVTRDYYCPHRGRVVLRSGCAYGAPVYLYGYNYRRELRPKHDFMGDIIDKAVGEVDETVVKAAEHHRALLGELTGKVLIVYNAHLESISIDGRHFIKFAPARILRKILRSYVDQQRTEFEYSDFTMDDTVIYDPVSPNLNVRVKRLIQAFDTAFPKMKLRKTGRGKLTFQPECAIEFREESGVDP
jgi:hypothetical protein